MDLWKLPRLPSPPIALVPTSITLLPSLVTVGELPLHRTHDPLAPGLAKTDGLTVRLMAMFLTA